MFVTTFWRTFITNTLIFQLSIDFCHSEHPVFFLVSGNRNKRLLQEIVMKRVCEMSLSPYVKGRPSILGTINLQVRLNVFQSDQIRPKLACRAACRQQARLTALIDIPLFKASGQTNSAVNNRFSIAFCPFSSDKVTVIYRKPSNIQFSGRFSFLLAVYDTSRNGYTTVDTKKRPNTRPFTILTA